MTDLDGAKQFFPTRGWILDSLCSMACGQGTSLLLRRSPHIVVAYFFSDDPYRRLGLAVAYTVHDHNPAWRETGYINAILSSKSDRRFRCHCGRHECGNSVIPAQPLKRQPLHSTARWAGHKIAALASDRRGGRDHDHFAPMRNCGRPCLGQGDRIAYLVCRGRIGVDLVEKDVARRHRAQAEFAPVSTRMPQGPSFDSIELPASRERQGSPVREVQRTRQSADPGKCLIAALIYGPIRKDIPTQLLWRSLHPPRPKIRSGFRPTLCR
jgi:hypothetical protein